MAKQSVTTAIKAKFALKLKVMSVKNVNMSVFLAIIQIFDIS